jgi:capsid protein
MSYELIMKDFSKTSYASVRAALMESWRFFSGRRKWICDYWLQPVYELWLEEAVNRGMVAAPGFYANRAAYCDSQWIGSAKGYVDPVREAQAAEDRMRIGISTLEREAAEQGADWEELLEQRAHELEKMRELNIPLSAVGAARNAGDVANVDQAPSAPAKEQAAP